MNLNPSPADPWHSGLQITPFLGLSLLICKLEAVTATARVNLVPGTVRISHGSIADTLWQAACSPAGRRGDEAVEYPPRPLSPGVAKPGSSPAR